MKVQELTTRIGALVLTLVQWDHADDTPAITVRVRDPIAFLAKLNENGTEAAEEKAEEIDDGTPWESPPPKKKRAYRKRRNVTPVPPVDDGRVHSPTGMGRGGPRLGMMSIKLEDLPRVRNALDAKDGSLSPLQRSVLRLRLGLGTEPHTVKEVAELLHLKFHSEVSEIVFSGLKVLGIRRQKTRRFKGRPSRAKAATPVEKPSAFTPVMEEQ